jgi:hypothetical protein
MNKIVKKINISCKRHTFKKNVLIQSSLKKSRIKFQPLEIIQQIPFMEFMEAKNIKKHFLVSLMSYKKLTK